jgi:hypothetical protein
MRSATTPAPLAGLGVPFTRTLVFTISGLLGGLLMAGMLSNANPSLGLGYELDVIATVVLGGVALTGGRGCIGGVVIGAAPIGLLRHALMSAFKGGGNVSSPVLRWRKMSTKLYRAGDGPAGHRLRCSDARVGCGLSVSVWGWSLSSDGHQHEAGLPA